MYKIKMAKVMSGKIIERPITKKKRKGNTGTMIERMKRRQRIKKIMNLTLLTEIMKMGRKQEEDG